MTNDMHYLQLAPSTTLHGYYPVNPRCILGALTIVAMEGRHLNLKRVFSFREQMPREQLMITSRLQSSRIIQAWARVFWSSPPCLVFEISNFLRFESLFQEINCTKVFFASLFQAINCTKKYEQNQRRNAGTDLKKGAGL